VKGNWSRRLRSELCTDEFGKKRGEVGALLLPESRDEAIPRKVAGERGVNDPLALPA
jgi:hypothetical protein